MDNFKKYSELLLEKTEKLKPIVKELNKLIRTRDLGISIDTAEDVILIGPKDGPLPVIRLFPNGKWES